MSDPATSTPRTTGGNARWEPPSPAELQEQMPGYTIEKLLGRGGMGAVYKGVQSNLDRTVAIKILPPGVEQEDPSFAERFKNEAKLMARLNNPAVVSVHDFGLTTGGLLYFAMEYVDGTDVSQMIRSQGKLPPEHALAITAHVCDALSAAHELGIVHRDIKPANVLINMKGQVKVADFGLAKIEEPGTHGLTKTGYAMGTPDFVAPEVLMLGSHIDGRADLYAVGVMLYQMLTGEVPRGAFKPATARLPGLDPRFDPIIMKAMQSDREERYQSSTELRRDLDVILTVPLVRQDEPPTSAIPAAQVAQTPAQRSAAQKPPARSAGAPARQPPAHAGEGTRAPVPPKKSSAPLLLGLGAAAAIGIGAFVMMGGDEKAQQSQPTKTQTVTSTATPPIKAREEPKAGDPSGSSLGASKPTAVAASKPPSTTVVQQTAAKGPQPVRLPDPAKWVKAFESPKSLESFKGQAEWTQSGIHLTGTIAPTNSTIQDAAVRLKVKKGTNIGLMLRAKKDNQWSANVKTSQGTANFQVTQDGAKLVLEQFDVPPSVTALEEIDLEFVGVGNILSLSINGVQAHSMVVPAKASTGMIHIFSADGYVRDIAWQSLDGPASAPEKTAAIAAAPVAPPPASSTPSAPASPSLSLPVSSSSPPATTTMAAAPASELDQRLAALDASFQAAVERDANTAFKSNMAALDKLYLGALDRSLATASKGGKLEEALALREEKQRIEKGEGVPSEVDESTQAPGKVPDTLKTLRQTYRSTTAQHEATKAKAMQPLYDKYDQALAAVQTELTKASQLDDAMRVKTVREQIAATRGSDEGSAGTPARTTSTGGAAAPMTEADKRAESARQAQPIRAPLIVGTFTNSLGMKFVPVPETEILMCTHETRRQDYAAFAAETPKVDATWKSQARDGIPCGHGDDHPVVGVNWHDAQAFCRWLSSKEGKTFRLPTDREWSIAVGLGRKEKSARDTTPKSLHNQAPDFPWDSSFPPKGKDLAGNYADTAWHDKFPDQAFIDRYTDGFPTTAPVMSFKPNKLGLYDMGGNVSEWVEDWFDAEQKERTARDGAFNIAGQSSLRSSSRHPQPPYNREGHFFGFRIVLETRAPASTSPAPTPTPTTAPPSGSTLLATKDKPFTNSLGMKFVPVPGTDVLFCIHETRKSDYAKYAAETPGTVNSWEKTGFGNPPVVPGDDHPVIMVSWEDAVAFCSWLSAKDGRKYRLPTDNEWSHAVGIGRKEKKDETPEKLSGGEPYAFPWGDEFPPPPKAGNYADTTYGEASPGAAHMASYKDGYAWTAPVMSFTPNRLGLYDLGGNVLEWCDDWFNEKRTDRVVRGGSWFEVLRHGNLSSTRRHARDGETAPGNRDNRIGFRIVLDTRAPASPSGAATKPATPTPTPTAAPAPAPATAAKSDFTNSLGMQFVKVPGTKVLFCIHETRKGDYAKYAAETPGVDEKWKEVKAGPLPVSTADDHPVIYISWDQAVAFCAWLSTKEGRKYRLPTDLEWSHAVGIARDENRRKGTTPAMLMQGPSRIYPWGTTEWPPPAGAGNYGDSSLQVLDANAQPIEGYTDGFAGTAPVMSFKPNKNGIHDLGGNVWEWCEDWFDESQQGRVLRGGSYVYNNKEGLTSRYRIPAAQDKINGGYGFRIVLETTE